MGRHCSTDITAFVSAECNRGNRLGIPSIDITLSFAPESLRLLDTPGVVSRLRIEPSVELRRRVSRGTAKPVACCPRSSLGFGCQAPDLTAELADYVSIRRDSTSIGCRTFLIRPHHRPQPRLVLAYRLARARCGPAPAAKRSLTFR